MDMKCLNKTPHWKNPNWKYNPACDTDIRRTFEKFAPIVNQKQTKDGK
jgi:hypothetical protein